MLYFLLHLWCQKKGKSCFNNCTFATQNSIERKGECLLNQWKFFSKMFLMICKALWISYTSKTTIFLGSFLEREIFKSVWVLGKMTIHPTWVILMFILKLLLWMDWYWKNRFHVFFLCDSLSFISATVRCRTTRKIRCFYACFVFSAICLGHCYVNTCSVLFFSLAW